MTTTQPGPKRAICDRCGARGWLQPGEQRTCAECGGPYRPMAPLEGLIDRWFAPPEQHVSELYPRHRKLIELMWTAGDFGRATYHALELERVSYSQFVSRANEIVLRGLAEGWIEAEIPNAPTDDDQAYRIHFVDPDRWAEELTAAFGEPEPA
jgi:hypothetical protein